MSILGKRLKTMRLEKKLTLETLASRAGVTKGFLSQVEAGSKGPSVSTLLRITQALDVPLSACFNPSKKVDTSFSLVRKKQRKAFERIGSRFGVEYQTVAHKKQRKNMEPFIMSPPLVTPTEYFQHPGDEMILVLNGRLRVWLDQKKFDLSEGDCIYFDGAVPHRTQSLGKSRSHALLVISVGSI